MNGSKAECLRWDFRDCYLSLKATTTQLSSDSTFADVIFYLANSVSAIKLLLYLSLNKVSCIDVVTFVLLDHAST